MLMQCFLHVKVHFEKKKTDSSLSEISLSCTCQKYDNVTTPYYSFFAPLFVTWSLTGVKNKGNFKLLAKRGGPLQEVPNIVI